MVLRIKWSFPSLLQVASRDSKVPRADLGGVTNSQQLTTTHTMMADKHTQTKLTPLMLPAFYERVKFFDRLFVRFDLT